jgi:hypothetical protein
LRRKPWVFGVQISHLHYATHAGILTSIRSTRPYGTDFTANKTLPYQSHSDKSE